MANSKNVVEVLVSVGALRPGDVAASTAALFEDLAAAFNDIGDALGDGRWHTIAGLADELSAEVGKLHADVSPRSKDPWNDVERLRWRVRARGN